MHQQLWGYKVQEKLYVRVREQKRLNTTELDNRGLFRTRRSILVTYFKHSLPPLSDINGCDEWLMNGREVLFIAEGNSVTAIAYASSRHLEDTSHEQSPRDVISPRHVTKR
jgi:hypothetical protein